MKKIFGLLLGLCLLTACDDGDLVLESFNFSSVAIQKCTDKTFLFKTNSDELLLVDIPESSFLNEVTPDGEPRIVNISGTNKVLYRKYSNAVGSTTVCNDIPPATPTVINEWNASNGGKIEIITTEKITIDPVTSEEVLTGYNHQIKFVNIQFVSPDNSFVFEEYLFGTYTTSL
ncbi:hypothetical protein [Flavobacterium sp.]|uniref:hypothetical protein n=1 Tax=Flavobacterium sp. TaxID=239 RepID=UPI0028BE7550|nr:hypothetical protein [Flavobacterium sp.]